MSGRERPRIVPGFGLETALDGCTLTLSISGVVTEHSAPGLCDQVCLLLNGNEVSDVICDVGEVVGPDAVTVETLARLQLATQRLGIQVTLRRAPDELKELLHLTGLQAVIPTEED